MTIALLLRRVALGALLFAGAGLFGEDCYGGTVGVALSNDGGGGGAAVSVQTDTLADRSTVVGVLAMLDCFTDSVTMRWTEADGVVAISDSPDRTATNASTGAAIDGSLLLGYSSTEAGIQAYLYDRKHGVRSLRDVLAARYDLGVDFSTAALDAIADQPNLARRGASINPTHRSTVARAWITAVPEPSTFALLATALGSAATAKLWKRRRA